jgi:uridylate kinase
MQGVDRELETDPNHNEHANKYSALHFNDIIQRDLKVVGMSAFILAREYGLPIHVFNFDRPVSMKEVCEGKKTGQLSVRTIRLYTTNRGSFPNTRCQSSS